MNVSNTVVDTEVIFGFRDGCGVFLVTPQELHEFVQDHGIVKLSCGIFREEMSR